MCSVRLDSAAAARASVCEVSAGVYAEAEDERASKMPVMGIVKSECMLVSRNGAQNK